MVSLRWKDWWMERQTGESIHSRVHGNDNHFQILEQDFLLCSFCYLKMEWHITIFPWKYVFCNQEINIDSYYHFGENVSYTEQSFVLLWWFSYSVECLGIPRQSTQTQPVPDGWKSTFSLDLLTLTPFLGELVTPPTQPSKKENGSHPRQLIYSVPIWTAGEQAQWISTSTWFSNARLPPVCPFSLHHHLTSLVKALITFCRHYCSSLPAGLAPSIHHTHLFFQSS